MQRITFFLLESLLSHTKLCLVLREIPLQSIKTRLLMDQNKMALYESTCNFHSVNKRRNVKEWRVLEPRKQHSVFFHRTGWRFQQDHLSWSVIFWQLASKLIRGIFSWSLLLLTYKQYRVSPKVLLTQKHLDFFSGLIFKVIFPPWGINISGKTTVFLDFPN